MSRETSSKTIVIEATPNGPYVVKDPPVLKNSRGEVIETKAVAALCRCGRSGNKPFCDGTHGKVGFSGARGTDGSADAVEDYEGASVTVHDNRGVCAHMGRCTDGLPSVFRLRTEPWIDPNGAKGEEVVRVVRQCPSGALAYTFEGTEHRDWEAEPSITVTKNGPYAVAGGIELLDTVTEQKPQTKDHYTLCRCGGSANKPFCDGTHWNGFEDEKN